MTKFGSYPAYELDGMTFCAECAYKATALGFLLAASRLPESMEDAIAHLVLTAVLKGEDPKPPAGVPAPTGTCDSGSCDRDLGEYAEEAA